MTQLIQEEAMTLAGEVIVQEFTNWMKDLDSVQALNTHYEVLSELAFEFGIKELSEADLDLVDDLVNSATAFIDIGWTESDEGE